MPIRPYFAFPAAPSSPFFGKFALFAYGSSSDIFGFATAVGAAEYGSSSAIFRFLALFARGTKSSFEVSGRAAFAPSGAASASGAATFAAAPGTTRARARLFAALLVGGAESSRGGAAGFAAADSAGEGVVAIAAAVALLSRASSGGLEWQAWTDAATITIWIAVAALANRARDETGRTRIR